MVIFIIIVIFFALLTLIPHYNFQTNAFDLGIFNQAIAQYAHFEFGPNTIREVPTLFADHMEITMLLMSPLYWIFGSYTLLIIQILMLVFGALGCYLLVENTTKNRVLATASAVIFSIFFGMVTAIAFDYHNNVIATMFVPWMFYTWDLKKFKWFYLYLILFLFSKENMALMAIFLGLSMIIFGERKAKVHGIVTVLVSAVYFIFVLKLISYLNGGSYDHWAYEALGSGPLSALKTIAFHPVQSFFLLFDNEIKIKMWILLLISGGALSFFQPKFAILLIPLIAQKFFSSDQAFWGFSHHYAVEFAPIIAIGSVMVIYKFFPKKLVNAAAVFLVLLNIGISSQIHLYNGDTILRIFNSKYYAGPEEKENIIEVLDLVKNAKSVSAQNTLVPHLRNKEITVFPEIADSEYILLNMNSKNTWPIKSALELEQRLNSVKENQNYQQLYAKKGVYAFKKL